MKKLKIGYFADGPWSHLAFEKIIEDSNIEVAFIVPRSDTKDCKLKNYAVEFKIDYIIFDNVNSNEALQKIKDYDCDLLVSMSYNQIFKKDILGITELGIINCHAGKLPMYRGRNILNWALINDEKEFGITVHFVDEGIDTGDIILQRTFPITDEDNYNSLLEIAYTECAEILYDALLMFVNNKVERIKQSSISEYGMYCGKRGAGDEIIDWNQSSRDIFNFIRSICHPGPVAVTYLDNKEVRINDSFYSKDFPNYLGKPGQILSKTQKGYLVKTKNSYIEVYTNDRLSVGKRFKNDR